MRAGSSGSSTDAVDDASSMWHGIHTAGTNGPAVLTVPAVAFWGSFCVFWRCLVASTLNSSFPNDLL